MFTDRFQKGNVFVTGAAALLVLLAVVAFLGQRGNEAKALDQPHVVKAMGGVIHTHTYYPLPRGKQIALVTVVSPSCLNRVHEEMTISQASKSPAYYPLAPGKRAVLIDAAVRACINKLLAGGVPAK